MPSRPRIGITCSFNSWPDDASDREALQRYLDAVDDGGAEGRLLWLTDAPPEQSAALLMDDLDALIIGGGPDLPPSMYGQTPLPKVPFKAVRKNRLVLE